MNSRVRPNSPIPCVPLPVLFSGLGIAFISSMSCIAFSPKIISRSLSMVALLVLTVILIGNSRSSSSKSLPRSAVWVSAFNAKSEAPVAEQYSPSQCSSLAGVKELNSSYHDPKTISFTVYPYYCNLNQIL